MTQWLTRDMKKSCMKEEVEFSKATPITAAKTKYRRSWGCWPRSVVTSREIAADMGRWLNMLSNNSFSGHGCSRSAAVSPSTPRKASARKARYGLTNLITRRSMALVNESFPEHADSRRAPFQFLHASGAWQFSPLSISGGWQLCRTEGSARCPDLPGRC